MSNPFLAEIKLFAGNFAPRGFALCNGQFMSISQNTALFSLIGTYYGGNGQSTFALPNLQSAVPIGSGSGPGLSQRVIGEQAGSAAVTLIASQMPQHQHGMQAYSNRTGAYYNTPKNGSTLAASQGGPLYAAANSNPVSMHPASVAQAGGSQPHNNVMPSLAVTFIIALQGVYPAHG